MFTSRLTCRCALRTRRALAQGTPHAVQHLVSVDPDELLREPFHLVLVGRFVVERVRHGWRGQGIAVSPRVFLDDQSGDGPSIAGSGRLAR